jgi:hypothetical protein
MRVWLRTLFLLCVCAISYKSLVGATSCFAQVSKTAVDAPIVLDFPSNYSMGELYVLKPGAGANDSEPSTSTHSPARGRLKLPPGTRTKLKVGYEGSKHMSDLDRLSPNSLFGINMKRLEVTDDDLKHVARLTGLQHVELEGTDISTKGVKYLEPLKSLRFLGVDKTLIRGDAMKSIGKHTQLGNLIIGHNDLDEECYKHLLGLKNLTNIQVDNTHLSEKGFEHIIKLPNLRVIKLSGNNRITDRAMAKLQNSKVEFLNVQNTGVGPGSLRYFLKMPHLTHLKLEGRNFSPDQQKEFTNKLPRVKLQFQGKERDMPKELFEPLH